MYKNDTLLLELPEGYRYATAEEAETWDDLPHRVHILTSGGQGSDIAVPK